MEFTETDKYTKHGCYIVGNLVIVDYQSEWENHPRYGQFNSMSVFDAIDQAKAELNKRYKVAEIVLSIPELVARVEVA